MGVRGVSCVLLLWGFSSATLCAGSDPFTIVVLPDTQLYAQKHPAIFHKQTEWIAASAGRLNIRFVTHLGDVIQDNEKEGGRQWNVASAAMARLDAVVPWGIVAGNHDLDRVNDESGKAEAYLKHFGPRRFEGKPWLAASSPNGLNTAQMFTAGGRKYLFLHLEIDAPDEAIAWAGNVLRLHPGVPTLLTTHVYLTRSGKNRERKSYCRGASGNGAQVLWERFISNHPEIFIVLCGHWCVEAVLLPKNHAGSVTIEMIADYQNRPNGGNGWLRLLTFDHGKSQIRVRTYSPWLEKYETDADSQFIIPLDLSDRFGGALEPAKEPGKESP